MNDDIVETQPNLEKNSSLKRYPSSGSSDEQYVNHPIKWSSQKRDENVYKKGKEKVVKGKPKRRPVTTYDSKKILADAMKASAKSTARNRSERIFRVSKFQMPSSGVVEVSGEESDGESGNKKVRKSETKCPKEVQQHKTH